MILSPSNIQGKPDALYKYFQELFVCKKLTQLSNLLMSTVTISYAAPFNIIQNKKTRVYKKDLAVSLNNLSSKYRGLTGKGTNILSTTM